jgi:hypothetical protein
MRKLVILAVAAILPVLAIAGFAVAGGGQSSLDALREATARYHDIEVAKAEHPLAFELPQTEAFGGGTCIGGGDAGAMGIHLLLPDRLDGTLVATEPEALLYERRNDGSLKLTGVEYVVAGGPQPELYGQKFTLTNLARYGSPDANVWTLHAWVWKPNPTPDLGIFAPWNPRVSCD